MTTNEELAKRVEAGEKVFNHDLYIAFDTSVVNTTGDCFNSLDAALSLLNRVLPGWRWQVGSAVGIDNSYWADIAAPKNLGLLGDEVGSPYFSSSKTPAAALVAAIIRAVDKKGG